MTRRFRISGIIVVVLAVTVCISTIARADMIGFDNTCGDAMWHTCCDCMTNMKCNNWSVPPAPSPICPAVPSAADDVTIVGNCTLEAAMAGDALTLTQSNGTFTCNGTLSIADEATFDGPFVWNSGAIGRAGGAAGQQATCNSGLTIQGADAKTLGTFGGFTLNNTANATWTGSGDWTIGQIPGAGAPAILRNQAGALFDVQTDADILQNSFGLGLIQNDGTLRKSAGSDVSDWKVALNNDGLVEVQSGELRLTGAGEASGEFNVSAGATLSFATVFFFEFKQGISFTGDGDAVLVDTGSNYGVLVNEDIDLNRFRVANSGSIGPNSNFGHINITEMLELDGANIVPPVTIKPGATLEHVGPNNSTVGDLFVEGNVDIQAGTLATFNKVITVNSGGVVEIHDGATLATVGLVNLPIQNNGTIQKTTGNGSAFVKSDFFEAFYNNAGGLIHVASGTLDFLETNILNEGGVWKIDAGATANCPGSFGQLFELNSGRVEGGGTLVVNRLKNNGGIVAPGNSPGMLTIASSVTPSRPGDFQQLTSGSLEIEVGGLDAGTEHDQLVVAGTATLGGTLELVQFDNFVPEDGDQITVLTAGFVTLDFDDVVLTGFPASIGATAQVVNGNSVVVTFSNDGSNNPGNTNGNDNTGNNTNDNGNTNDNTGDNGNANNNGNTNGNDNTGAPQETPGNADCGAGACGAGVPPLMLAMMVVWGGARRRRRGVRPHRGSR